MAITVVPGSAQMPVTKTPELLIAKDDQTHRECSNQFETRKVFKEYVALTAGELGRDTDYIEGRIKHHPHDRSLGKDCLRSQAEVRSRRDNRSGERPESP